MWTKEGLQQIVRRELGDYRLIVVSNRQPYVHQLVDGKVHYEVPTGGLIEVDPIVRTAKGPS
ncbi:MAG: hypothetical protein O2909_01635 [Chloroflexi bacterium]|nr:hypothetical protein [Chloroflexota bacterium]MDA1218131.1 hypothetical protein [Chloroflexota bacterium]